MRQQHDRSQDRRFNRSARWAITVVVAVLAGLVPFGAPAWAAPAAPTVHIEDGGDGVLASSEITTVMVSGTWDASDPSIDEVIARITNDPACGETASGTPTQSATLNPDGTWTAGPFDLSDGTLFPEGGQVCARARASASGTPSEVGTSDNQPLKDTIAGAGTVDIDDGDGIVGPDEVSSGVPATWDGSTTDAATAKVWFEDGTGAMPAGCGPWNVAPSGSGALNPTCAQNMPEGQIFFKATWTDAYGNVSTEASDVTTKDTVPPLVIISILDGDGSVSSAEAETGIDVEYEVIDGVDADITVANIGHAAPAECTFPDQPAGPSTLAVPSTCFEALDDGDIVVEIVALDLTGNEGSGAAMSSLDTFVADFAALILDGGDGAASAEESAQGAALPVRFDIDPSAGTEVFTASLSATDGTTTVLGGPKLVTSASSASVRRVSVDVSSLSDGPVDVLATLTDRAGNTADVAVSTVLDRVAPTSAWNTPDGSSWYRLWNPLAFMTFGCCTVATGTLEGSTTDATTPVQFVYIEARNTNTGKRIEKPARMSARSSTDVTWTVDVSDFERGTWNVSVFAQDEAGNLESPKTITVSVQGN